MEMWLWFGIVGRAARRARRAAVARGPAGRAGTPAAAGVAPRLVRAVGAAHVSGRRRAHVCSRGAVLDASRRAPRAPGRAAAGRPRPVRGVDRDARRRRPGQHAVGRPHAGDRPAHGPVVRRRHPADRAGGPGVLDPAAPAPGRRHRRERRRDQRARGPVPRAARRAARRDRRAHRAGRRRHRAQRPGDRPVRRRAPRAGSARRAHDRARAPDRALRAAGPHDHRGDGRVGRLAAGRHGRVRDAGLRAGDRPAGAPVPGAADGRRVATEEPVTV